MMNKILIFIVFSLFIEAGVTCNQFDNWQAAQIYYKAKKTGYKGLDRNHDGIACQRLKTKAMKLEKYRLITYINGSTDNIYKIYNSLSDCKQGIKRNKSIIKNKAYSYKCIK